MPFVAPLTGIVFVPDRGLASAIVWAVVILVIGTLVRIALTRTETRGGPLRIVKRRPSAPDAA
jgi:hypothetical protein